MEKRGENVRDDMTHDQWDLVADAVNPLLLIVFLAFSYAAFAGNLRGAAPFAVRFWLAILITWLLTHVDKWIHVLRNQDGFPSGHMAFLLTVATAFFLLQRRSLWVTAPLAVLYGWLIVWMDYHSWWDLLSALIIAVPTTLVLFWKGANAERGRFPFLTATDFSKNKENIRDLTSAQGN
ncbi:MAG: phosphatase PAP2 family protein [Terrimicrobiaceae bacterium]